MFNVIKSFDKLNSHTLKVSKPVVYVNISFDGYHFFHVILSINYTFQINMKVGIIAKKSGITFAILILLAKCYAGNSSRAPEYINKKDEADQSDPKRSFCPLKSWLQQISDPTFECHTQEGDGNDSIPTI